ncbi:hypothetical protein P170DRAFT_431325 [Aspergillus steynii IBT 23096]|uniref:Hydrophobin n=1 Tax=Aspergillus steynii IBT 23096 TaxID=1392250 RepID=A0A2I2FRX0_9EURO|nr:uncharacterized protein P170DRAFT_431325 [Aspergillus steynii IBT 23096]PLB43380.1 hypothetical protein P170DRAFT_431325 [Aspergillus steynii IBT 23096]
MKSFLAILLPLASLALAQELPVCDGGALKCCAGVTPYSVLPNEILADYGVDSEDEGNICGNGTPIDDEFDFDICDAAEDTVQCCLPFVPVGELAEDLTFNCHDI